MTGKMRRTVLLVLVLAPGLARLGWGWTDDEGLVMTSTEPDATHDPSWLRQRAYAAAGVGFQSLLAGATYPSTGAFTGRRPISFRVDWVRQESENVRRYPYTNWRCLDYGTGPAVIYSVFNMKYLDGSRNWFDQYFTKIPTLKYLRQSEIVKILDNEETIRQNAMVFAVCFSPLQTRFAYYPGDLLFHGGERLGDPWLEKTSEAIRSGARTDHKVFADATGLVALINGTFIHHDNYSMYERGGFRYGGFGWDFAVIAPPQPGMATAALYEDGTMRLGSWRNLPDRQLIRTFVQNKFMILEGGAYGRDASPPHYTRYDDMIVRSYLFRHGNGVFGYLWTFNLPPQICAKLAHDAGIVDMMILDIHSPVSCQVALPGAEPRFADWKAFKRGSFNFVPVFSDASAVGRSVVAVSRALDKGVQFDYRREAFEFGVKDHFAIFLKDSREARRFSEPRCSDLTQARTLPGTP